MKLSMNNHKLLNQSMFIKYAKQHCDKKTKEPEQKKLRKLKQRKKKDSSMGDRYGETTFMNGNSKPKARVQDQSKWLQRQAILNAGYLALSNTRKVTTNSSKPTGTSPKKSVDSTTLNNNKKRKTTHLDEEPRYIYMCVCVCAHNLSYSLFYLGKYP